MPSERLQRLAPTVVVVLVALLTGLSFGSGLLVLRHFKADATATSRLYSGVFGGLNDPRPGAEAEALLRLGAQVRALGLPLVVTDRAGRVTAAANLPFQAALDDPRVKAYAARLDRWNPPIVDEAIGTVHYLRPRRGPGVRAGNIAAGPTLLRNRMASLRLVMPLALAGSVASFAGAVVGLSLSTESLQTRARRDGHRDRAADRGVQAIRTARGPVDSDALGAALRMKGEFEDPAAGARIDWRTHRTVAGFGAFGAHRLSAAALFGSGAGFANVPALNLLMAAPLKVAVGSSGLIISVINSSAAWVYIHRGAVLPCSPCRRSSASCSARASVPVCSP